MSFFLIFTLFLENKIHRTLVRLGGHYIELPNFPHNNLEKPKIFKKNFKNVQLNKYFFSSL